MSSNPFKYSIDPITSYKEQNVNAHTNVTSHKTPITKI